MFFDVACKRNAQQAKDAFMKYIYRYFFQWVRLIIISVALNSICWYYIIFRSDGLSILKNYCLCRHYVDGTGHLIILIQAIQQNWKHL